MKQVRVLLWVAVTIALVFYAILEFTKPTSPAGITMVKAGGDNKSATGEQAKDGQDLAEDEEPADDRYTKRFDLTAHTGETFSSDSLKGKYRLMYFGYTFCPDACPLDLAKIARALKILEGEGLDTQQVQPLFVSIDPERDTAEQLAGYVPLFHPNLIGLTGSAEQIDDLAKRFGVYYRRVEQDDMNDYLMDHLVVIFLMDRNGDFIRLFSKVNDAESIADALRGLIT